MIPNLFANLRHKSAGDSYGFESVLEISRDHQADASSPKNMVTAWDLSSIGLIEDPGKNILLHFWSPSVELRRSIDGARFSSLPNIQLAIELGEIESLGQQVTEPLPRQILSEMSEIISKFASVSGAQRLKIQFIRVIDSSCPLFHIDRVGLRLLCTFVGPGTEWLDDAHVRRKFLGKGGNQKITKPQAIVYSLQPFQVCLLKGEPGLNQRGRGIVHRSPHVPEGRWFMRVDTVD
jgi:hypothetical protein